MLHLSYQLTEKEFLDYNFYTAWQGPERKSARIKYYIRGPVIFLIIITAFNYYQDNGRLKTSSFIIEGIGLLILFTMFRYRIRSVFDKQALKMIEQSGPGTILSAIELMLDENGIFGKTKVSETKYSWNAFKKKVRVNDCYYLYTNIRQALVIPLRAFSSPKEKEEFEKILLAYFPLEAELEDIKK